MSSSPSFNDRMMAAAGYAMSLVIPIPLIIIPIAYLVYYLLRDYSDFAQQHLKQNVNLLASLHLYTIGLFLLYFIFASAGGAIGWLSEKIPMLGILLTLGGISTIFLSIIVLLLITAVFIVLIIFALLGQWFRVPLIIRFIK